MTTHEVLVYSVVVLVAVGVPGLDALLNWLYPFTPEQEEARRLAIQRSCLVYGKAGAANSISPERGEAAQLRHA